MQIPIIAATLACGLALTACGAEEPAAADPQQDRREAMLAFAECMRDHGVDVPDPQFDGGRVMQRGPDERIPPEKFREAEEACRKLLKDVEPPELSEEQQKEMQEGALAHAQCMRKHGIEKFPDPTFDEDGGAQIRIGAGHRPRPRRPGLQGGRGGLPR